MRQLTPPDTRHHCRRQWWRLLALCYLALHSVTTSANSTLYRETELAIGRDPHAALQTVQAQLDKAQLPQQRAEWRLLESQAHYLLVDAAKAQRAAEAGLTEPEARVTTLVRQRLQLALANALDLQGDAAAGLLRVEPIVQAAESGTDNELLVEALLTRGVLLTSLTDFSSALDDLNRAYKLAPHEHPVIAKGDVAGAIANAHDARYDDQQAIPWFEQAVAHQRKNDNRIGLSIALFGLGAALKRNQQLDKAEPLLLESLQLSAALGDDQGVAYAEKELAGLAIVRGDYTLAAQRFDHAAALFERTGNPFMKLDITIGKAKIAERRGRYDEAERLLQEAEQQANQLTMPMAHAQIARSRASTAAAQKAYQRAYEQHVRFFELYDQARRVSGESQLANLRAQFASAQARQQSELLQHQNALQQARLHEQAQQLWLYVSLFALFLVSTVSLLFFAWRSRQTRQHLTQLALTDELTGVANRRHIFELLKQECERAKRYQLPLCVVAIDLDHFKRINDQYGHAVGDSVLREFASASKQILRQTDHIGRIGGEEFLICLPHTELNEAQRIIQRLQDAMQILPRTASPEELTVSFSAGLTVLLTSDQNADSLLARADEAMYRAKQAGRNRVELSPTNLHKTAADPASATALMSE